MEASVRSKLDEFLMSMILPYTLLFSTHDSS